MYEDKRVAPRFSFTEPVGYGVPDLDVNGSVAGNISIGGVSLKVQQFVPIGTELELQIRLDVSPKVIWVRAHVVRVRESLSEDSFEIGLKFIEDNQCGKAVREYINNQTSRRPNF